MQWFSFASWFNRRLILDQHGLSRTLLAVEKKFLVSVVSVLHMCCEAERCGRQSY
jgi:hypothetical protein